MMQAAELAVLDWLQAHLRCDFLDAVMPWISRICCFCGSTAGQGCPCPLS